MSSFDLFLYAYVLAFDRISVRHEIATRVTMETNLAGGVVIQRIFMADVTYVTYKIVWRRMLLRGTSNNLHVKTLTKIL